MQKKDVAILAGGLAYGILFHLQNAGLNFLVFSVLICILLAVSDPAYLKNRSWLLFAFLSIWSGAFVFIHGSTLAIFANITSLLLLSATTKGVRSSVLVNLFNAVFSVAGSIVFIALRISNWHKRGFNIQSPRAFKNLIFLGSVLLIVIFLAIYKNINPLFEKYTAVLNLDFISVGWIFFTLAGMPLIHSIIRHERVSAVDAWEGEQSRKIEKDAVKNFNPSVKKALTVVFIALNLMLILINILDINYLYLGAGMPQGVTHKQFVHNGVGMLIFSILLGIGIVLAAFNGNLNFDEKNRAIKLLVSAWLVQNLFMMVSTALRNHIYIHEALLTYKRIGVYFWLFMAGIGLITTLIKVWRLNSTWKLMRMNAFAACLVFVGSAGIDWDSYIGDYNISRIKYLASLDKKYLMDLSEANIGSLYVLKNSPGFEVDSMYHYEYGYGYSNKGRLDRKLYYFLEKMQKTDWRSRDLRSDRVFSEIKQLDSEGRIDTLDLRNIYSDKLSPLLPLRNIKVLKLNYFFQNVHSRDSCIDEINHFKNIHTLYLTGWEMPDTARFRNFRYLQTLYLHDNVYRKDSVELMAKKYPFRVVIRKNSAY